MDRRIQVIIALMESRVSARLDIGELAREVNLSPSRLRHLFKRETGNTLAQHLKHLRMQKAECLLRTTFLSVKEVMAHVGVNDPSHFSRDFRRHHGVPPTGLRRRSWGAADWSSQKDPPINTQNGS